MHYWFCVKAGKISESFSASQSQQARYFALRASWSGLLHFNACLKCTYAALPSSSFVPVWAAFSMLLCFLTSFLSLVLRSVYIIQLTATSVTLVFFSLSLHHHLVQLIRFLVVELTHSVLNPKFDMNLYLRLIILLVRDNVYIDSETLLVADFVNFKIKSAQSFEYMLIEIWCVCVCS
jgi:hypothetical protein